MLKMTDSYRILVEYTRFVRGVGVPGYESGFAQLGLL